MLSAQCCRRTGAFLKARIETKSVARAVDEQHGDTEQPTDPGNTQAVNCAGNCWFSNNLLFMQDERGITNITNLSVRDRQPHAPQKLRSGAREPLAAQSP